MKLRLRQICLVAHQLAPAIDDLKAILGLEVCHVDPGVGKWGLENALLTVGNQFLEVVAPVQENTAAGRYLERRRGDGGYMVIMQTGDIAAYRKRVADRGIRLVADLDYGDYNGMQLHPRDTGGAIMSIDWSEGDPRDPAGPWHPAGPDWQKARRIEVTRAIRAAELQADDPEALARRWSDILDIPVVRDARSNPIIPLDDAILRFVRATDGRGEGLGGLDLAVADREHILREAEARGCAASDDMVTVCGTRLYLV